MIDTYRNNPAVSGTEVVRAAAGASVRQFHNREFSHPAQVAMRIGTYAHALVFEPGECAARYAVPFTEPAGLPTTMEAKRAWLAERDVATPAKLRAAEVDALFQEHGGPSRERLFADYARTVLGEIPNADEWARALAIRDAVMSHPTARELIHGGTEAESEFYWLDPETGVECKGKLDLLGTFRGRRCVISDLKTGSKKSPDEIRRTMRYDNKWMQFFHYLNGLEFNGQRVDGVFIIGADTSGPDVEVCVCEISLDSMFSMSGQYAKALKRAAQLKAASPEFDGADGFGVEVFNIRL